MSRSKSLPDRDQIAEVKARYCRYLDTKDWASFRGLFSEDAKLGPIENGIPGAEQMVEPVSIDEFMARVEDRLADVVSVHHGHMPEIAFDDESHARATWAMEDLLLFPEGTSIRRLRGYGHYHETYEKSQGSWRITSLALTRLHVDVDPMP